MDNVVFCWLLDFQINITVLIIINKRRLYKQAGIMLSAFSGSKLLVMVFHCLVILLISVQIVHHAVDLVWWLPTASTLSTLSSASVLSDGYLKSHLDLHLLYETQTVGHLLPQFTQGSSLPSCNSHTELSPGPSTTI